MDADKKQSTFTDMKLKGDGTCSVVLNSDGRAYPDQKYQVTGKQISLTVRLDSSSTGTWELRIASVTETELVMEHKAGDAFVKVRYTRAK